MLWRAVNLRAASGHVNLIQRPGRAGRIPPPGGNLTCSATIYLLGSPSPSTEVHPDDLPTRAPAAPGSYGPGAGGAPPPNYLVWAILSTILCCVPAGIVSIVFATKVNSKWQAGDQAGALKASNNAKTWAIVAAVLGVIVGIISIALQAA